MSLWDALTDIQKKVTEGVEQFQEVFDPNAVASPPPRPRPVSSAAFSVDNEDTAAKKPGDDAASRRHDAPHLSRDAAAAASRHQTNSGGPSRTLATASRDELVALVQRQAAKIQQLQARFDESHQENQVLRQERDTLKNMLRASDAELTEVKKSRAAIPSAAGAGYSRSVQDDASLVDLRYQVSHLEKLLAEKSSSNLAAEMAAPSGAADSDANTALLLERDAAKSACSQLQVQLESMRLQSQKLQQDHAIAVQSAHQRISLLESENALVLTEAAACRSRASDADRQTAEAKKNSSLLNAELAQAQAQAASSGAAASQLRTTIRALEMSLATYSSIAQSKCNAATESVAVQAADISTEMSMHTELQFQSSASLAAHQPSEPQHSNASAQQETLHHELLRAQAVAESASAEVVASRAQLSVAESRISELTAKLDELQCDVAKQVQEGTSLAVAHHARDYENESSSAAAADIAAVRSEMEDLITAMDHLSAAVASVNFPNQPALPTHSLPCHLSKIAFTSFKQLADAVDAVVSQLVRFHLPSFHFFNYSYNTVFPLNVFNNSHITGFHILGAQADVDFSSRQAIKALKISSDSECDKLKSLLSSCRSQLDHIAPELDSSRSKIKKLEQQLQATEGLYKTLQSELCSSEQVRQALNLELKRLEQALSSASFSTSSSSSADSSLFISALQWSHVGEAAGWSIRRRVHVDACVWALICSGSYRFWMVETDLMRHLGEKGVSVGAMFDALPPPIVLDTRDHAAANILKEKQIEIVSLEKKVHELTNELQKLQIKGWVQPQHEVPDFSSQDVRPAAPDIAVPSLPEAEADSHNEADRLVLIVGDLERKLAHASSMHAQVVASLRSELESSQAKVAEADTAARQLLLSAQEQLEQQCISRIEDIKRKSRVSARSASCCLVCAL